MTFWYRLVIAYNGSSYHGWQIQPREKTIAGVLQKTCQQLFDTDAHVIGASRTDAGVHAWGQIARLSLGRDIAPKNIKKVLELRLPPDIMVRSIKKSDSKFHPLYNVASKTYYYHLFVNKQLFVAPFGHRVTKPFCPKRLQEALQVFVGTFDFRSFCTGDEHNSTIRTINAIDVQSFKRFGVYQIKVHGQSFLRYMIRRIVGAALDYATKPERTLDDLYAIFAACDPRHKLPTAPASGLLLRKIVYKESA